MVWQKVPSQPQSVCVTGRYGRCGKKERREGEAWGGEEGVDHVIGPYAVHERRDR